MHKKFSLYDSKFWFINYEHTIINKWIMQYYIMPYWNFAHTEKWMLLDEIANFHVWVIFTIEMLECTDQFYVFVMLLLLNTFIL